MPSKAVYYFCLNGSRDPVAPQVWEFCRSHCSPRDTGMKVDGYDVLEHIDTPAEFLNSAYESLQPGGRMYLTVPAYQTLWSNEDSSAGHYRRYSPQTLAETFRKSGFPTEVVNLLDRVSSLQSRA